MRCGSLVIARRAGSPRRVGYPPPVLLVAGGDPTVGSAHLVDDGDVDGQLLLAG